MQMVVKKRSQKKSVKKVAKKPVKKSGKIDLDSIDIKEDKPRKLVKSKNVSSSDRIPTFVPGFDAHIEGGFVEKSVNLVSGGPGAGKTIFAMQFLYDGAMNGERGLYISFEEELDNLLGDALIFSWDFKKLEKEKKCFLISSKPTEEPNLQYHISKIVKKNKVHRIVIDSVSVFSMMFKNDQFRIRREYYKLVDFLKKDLGCTVLLTAEVEGEPALDVTAGGGSLSRDGVIEFIADSVITLHNSGIGGEADRAIRILKMRRTNHTIGPIPMSLTNQGMKVLE